MTWEVDLIEVQQPSEVLRELLSNPKNTPGHTDSSRKDCRSNTMFELVAALAEPLRREERTDLDKDRWEPDRNTILRG